jgi:hypothetical protein
MGGKDHGQGDQGDGAQGHTKNFAAKNATGKDLKPRIAALGGSAVVPTELLDATDEVRLLGNDAAHIDKKDYDEIGDDEAAVAIELAKELLKSV